MYPVFTNTIGAAMNFLKDLIQIAKLDPCHARVLTRVVLIHKGNLPNHIKITTPPRSHRKEC
eukprot:6081220-Pleurochrysis_carterae.AAC.1